MKSTLLLAAVAATAATAAALWPVADAPPPVPVPAVSAAPVLAPAPTATAATNVPAAAAAADAAPAAAVATYPDGSTMPLLNGVREPVTVQWPANRPFSPIVETVADERGVSWYRHRDGTWSTVRMLRDAVRGLDVATSQVFSPMPVKQRTRLAAPNGG